MDGLNELRDAGSFLHQMKNPYTPQSFAAFFDMWWPLFPKWMKILFLTLCVSLPIFIFLFTSDPFSFQDKKAELNLVPNGGTVPISNQNENRNEGAQVKDVTISPSGITISSPSDMQKQLNDLKTRIEKLEKKNLNKASLRFENNTDKVIRKMMPESVEWFSPNQTEAVIDLSNVDFPLVIEFKKLEKEKVK